MNISPLLIPVLFLMYWIVSAVLKHQERLALIQKGMDPNLADREDQDRCKQAAHQRS